MLLYDMQILVPMALQKITQEKIHQDHQGMLEHAKHSVRWPGISKDINNLIKKCLTCSKKSVT